MRGLKRHRSARILGAGHAFAQNLRRGHHDIATDAPSRHLLRATFDNLAIIIRPAKISNDHALTLCAMGQRNNAHRNWYAWHECGTSPSPCSFAGVSREGLFVPD
jgi:hypothetical protein